MLKLLQAGEDPFGDQRKEKKARIASQEGRQLKNKQASDKIHGKPVLPPTLKLAASLPEHGKGIPTKRRELKADVRHHNVMHVKCVHTLYVCIHACMHACFQCGQVTGVPLLLACCLTVQVLSMAWLGHSRSADLCTGGLGITASRCLHCING